MNRDYYNYCFVKHDHYHNYCNLYFDLSYCDSYYYYCIAVDDGIGYNCYCNDVDHYYLMSVHDCYYHDILMMMLNVVVGFVL